MRHVERNFSLNQHSILRVTSVLSSVTTNVQVAVGEMVAHAWTNIIVIILNNMDNVTPMNEEKDLILADLYGSIKASRTEEFYIPIDGIVDCLDIAFGDEAILIAQKILKKHGM